MCCILFERAGCVAALIVVSKVPAIIKSEGRAPGAALRTVAGLVPGCGTWPGLNYEKRVLLA